MITSGYSKKTLIEKLGIKDGNSLLVLNEPENYFKLLGPLPKNVKLKIDGSMWDIIHFFATDKKQLEKMFPFLIKSLKRSGMLWISWSKKTSKILTDLNENIIREIGLSHGVVDVKVCAIDETWSGLKFVYRLEDR